MTIKVLSAQERREGAFKRTDDVLVRVGSHVGLLALESDPIKDALRRNPEAQQALLAIERAAAIDYASIPRNVGEPLNHKAR